MGLCIGYQRHTEYKDDSTENSIFLMFKLLVNFI
jgi:hypothetical protein